jgi:maltooligosyltrehalose synthase
METVTIACPVGVLHPEVNPETAPFYADKEGVLYQVASGIIEIGEALPPEILIQVGLPGLDALQEMGLVLVDQSESNEETLGNSFQD